MRNILCRNMLNILNISSKDGAVAGSLLDSIDTGKEQCCDGEHQPSHPYSPRPDKGIIWQILEQINSFFLRRFRCMAVGRP